MLKLGTLHVIRNYRLVGVTILSVLLVACATPEHAGMRNAGDASLSRSAPNPVWRSPTRLELTLKHGAEVSAWRCSYSPEGAVLIESLAADAAGSALLLVNGRALAVRGAIPVQREVLDLVDDVMLNQQLATRLLQQASPLGPELVIAPQPVQVDESGDAISIETTNTTRSYYPPWKLRGQLRRETADSVGFDLQFNAQPAGAATRTEKYALSGIWQQQSPAKQIPDDFSLQGWSVYRIRVGTRSVGDISMAAYVTTPDSRRYQTLGELRSALPVGR